MSAHESSNMLLEAGSDALFGCGSRPFCRLPQESHVSRPAVEQRRRSPWNRPGGRARRSCDEEERCSISGNSQGGRGRQITPAVKGGARESRSGDDARWNKEGCTGEERHVA